MSNFNEHSLEMSLMELSQDEGYLCLNSGQIRGSVRKFCSQGICGNT